MSYPEATRTRLRVTISLRVTTQASSSRLREPNVDAPTLFSLTAIVVSLLAFAGATYFSRQQVSLLKSANNAAVLVKLLDEFRDHRFHDKLIFVATKLQAEYPPTGLAPDGQSCGLFDLDESVRADVLDVAYYFHGWASLAHVGLISDRQLAFMLHVRFVNAWKAIAPYVIADRAKHPEMGTFLSIVQKYGELLDTPEMRRHYPKVAA
jgi:hypothetical protein